MLESILLILEIAAKRGKLVTQYSVLKTLFLADRAHLNRYGRPITYDNYVAMKDGPVASYAYNMLKGTFDFERELGAKEAPWESRKAPEFSPKAMVFHSPRRKPDLDILSETDVEEIGSSLTTVLSLTFNQLRRLTHEDPAYLDAWDDEGDQKRYPMSYGMLFDVPDFDEAKNLAFVSQHI